MQQVLIGTAGRVLPLEGCQLLQPQVEAVELGQVQAAIRQPVRLCLVQGHQVLEVHTQYRQPEARAACPGASITGVVVVGGQELRQLQQGLSGRANYVEGRHVFAEASSISLAPWRGVF